jgi:hypothetical protein
MSQFDNQSRAQDEALAFLTSVYGTPEYVNNHRPDRAIWADFAPCDAFPYGSCWRIEPDGAVEDVTKAMGMDE